MSKEPLMERNIIPELVGLSYKEYLKKRKKSKFDKFFNDIPPELTNLDDFDQKIQYLIETVNDLSTKQKEILDLWNICYRIINNDTDFRITYITDDFLVALISITGEAKFDKNVLDQIDTDLDNCIKLKFKERLKQKKDYKETIYQLNHWLTDHFKYLRYLEIGLTLDQLRFLQSIIENYPTEFSNLKSNSPTLFIRFIETVKSIYIYTDQEYRIKFQAFYLKICLEQIIVAKNSGNFYGYDKILDDYYSVKLNNKKYQLWIFKNLIGYGEKPERLIGLFLLTNLFFSLIFTVSCLKFHFPVESSGYIEKFLTFLTFNNTTMMTVGYGDIYPEGIGARFMVALLQILGFLISGSAITLYLRKLFRF